MKACASLQPSITKPSAGIQNSKFERQPSKMTFRTRQEKWTSNTNAVNGVHRREAKLRCMQVQGTLMSRVSPRELLGV